MYAVLSFNHIRHESAAARRALLVEAAGQGSLRRATLLPVLWSDPNGSIIFNAGPRHSKGKTFGEALRPRREPKDLFSSSCFYSWALIYVTLFPKQPPLII